MRASDDDIEALMQACDRVYDGLDSPIAWLVDGSGVGMISAQGRRSIAAHLDRNRAAMGQFVRGMAIVAPTPLLRGVVKAISWLAPFNFDQEVFASRAPAEAWARARLAR